MPRPISPSRPPTAVIFDLGGVLIDWDPRYLYRGLFTDAAAMESFLAEVTTPAWNAEQDAGRPWAEAVAMLVERHPEQRDLIEAYHRRWSEMLAGAIDGTVAILQEVRGSDVRLFALSNWSAETFPIARQRFPFLAWFDGIVISGDVGAVKPDAKIFEPEFAAKAADVQVDPGRDMPVLRPARPGRPGRRAAGVTVPSMFGDVGHTRARS